MSEAAAARVAASVDGGLVSVLLLALVPALGNFAGGMIAEVVAVSPRAISRALHAAAGIVLAVVSVEIMPEALGGAPGWAIALAFLLGAAFYLLVEWMTEGVQKAGRGRVRGAGMWMIYVAVAMDLFAMAFSSARAPQYRLA